MRYMLFCSLCFISSWLSAHNPNEANYKIYEEDARWQLAIHFTPVAAIKILHQKISGLKKQPFVRLENHHKEIADYFSSNVLLKADGRPLEWAFQSADLGDHDARMLFELKNMPREFDELFVQVDAFTELYRKPYNRVDIVSGGWSRRYTLNKNKRIVIYSSQQEGAIQQAGLPLKPISLASLVIILILLAYVVIRK